MNQFPLGKTIDHTKLKALSAEELELKINRGTEKLRVKKEKIENQIKKLQESLVAYANYRQAEIEACKKLIVEKKPQPLKKAA